MLGFTPALHGMACAQQAIENKPTISAAGRMGAKLYSKKPDPSMNRISLLGLCINIVIVSFSLKI